MVFPIADRTAILSGGDQVLRTSTLIRDRPDRAEEQGNLRGESDGSSSTLLQDSSWYDGEARSDFWSIQAIWRPGLGQEGAKKAGRGPEGWKAGGGRRAGRGVSKIL